MGVVPFIRHRLQERKKPMAPTLAGDFVGVREVIRLLWIRDEQLSQYLGVVRALSRKEERERQRRQCTGSTIRGLLKVRCLADDARRHALLCDRRAERADIRVEHLLHMFAAYVTAITERWRAE